jgi:hypothetical protein
VTGSSQGGRGGSFNGGTPLAPGPGGLGIAALGAAANGANNAGGTGVSATGGLGGGGNSDGGIGVEAFGGFRTGTGTNGVGVRDTEGGVTGFQASGVVGLDNSRSSPAVSGQNSGAGGRVFGNSASGIGVPASRMPRRPSTATASPAWAHGATPPRGPA